MPRRSKLIWSITILIVLTIMLFLVIQSYKHYQFKLPGSVIDSKIKGNSSPIKLIPVYDTTQVLIFDGYIFLVNPNLLDKIPQVPSVVYSFNVSHHELVYNYEPNKTTIVLIGDSYTQGSGVKPNETFGYFLFNLTHFNVIDLAHGGYSTKLEVESLEKLGLKYHPDYVILQVAFNDYEDPVVLYSLMETVKSTLRQHNISFDDHLVSQEVYRFYNDEYYEKNSDFFIKKNIEEPLEKLAKLAKAYNFSVIMIKIPLPPKLDRVFEDYARRQGWVILDLHELMGFEYKQPFVLSDIDLHFSKQTHKEVAELLMNHIKNAK